MDKIFTKLDELLQLLENQPEIIRYNEIEKKLLENDHVKQKIAEYKKMQQKLTIYASKKQEVPKESNDKLDELYNELMEIPIFNEYLNLQTEINSTLQQITNLLSEELNNN